MWDHCDLRTYWSEKLQIFIQIQTFGENSRSTSQQSAKAFRVNFKVIIFTVLLLPRPKDPYDSKALRTQVLHLRKKVRVGGSLCQAGRREKLCAPARALHH